MPSYILPDGVTPLDKFPDTEIKEGLKKFGITGSSFNEYKLSYNDKWDLFKFLERFAADSDGQPIPPELALQRCDYFMGNPRIIEILKPDFDKFWAKVQLLKAKVPSGNDMGLRFYVGRN